MASAEITASTGENAEETTAALTFASRLAALRSENCVRLRSVRLNAWATLMPPSSSASVARDVADRLLPVAERAARDEAEEPGDAKHDRHDEQRRQREPPVHPEHGDERGDQSDHGAEEPPEPCERNELTWSMSLMSRLIRSPDSTDSK